MSIHSARNQLETLESSSGYCFPLTLDAIMHGADLPRDHYEDFVDAYKTKSVAAFNTAIKNLLESFFGVTAEPGNNTSHVAEYSAYGASAQSYCPDVPYEYDLTNYEGTGITNKHLRLNELLKRAGSNQCNILFSTPSKTGAHVAGLELIDTLPLGYLVRNTEERLRPHSNRIFGAHELWLPTKDNAGENYSPLPEFNRSFYPPNETSWEMFILPPSPQ